VVKKTEFAGDRLAVAIAGMGWWGKTIAEALKDSPKVHVVKAIDPVPAAGEWVKSRGIEFTTDYEAVLADARIAAVILCTPHSLHRQQIEAAAKAKKHILCEKPLALTRRDALAAVEACETNRVVLGIGHEHRFKPVLQDLLRMVKTGELGTIQMSEATFTMPGRPMPADNWRLQSRERPGGPMTALGVHGTDLCIAVNGPADRVWTSLESLGGSVTNTLGAVIHFKSGANAVLTAIQGPPFSIRFAVFGNKGWVEVHDKAHPEAPEGWIVTKGRHDSRPERCEYPAMSMLQANAEAFADAIAGRAPYPVSHKDMVDNIALFEAICKSTEKGGEPVAVEN
jgi:predicted dehydrogenase